MIGSLTDADGNLNQLRSTSDHRLQVICFIGCDCPLAKLYGPRLKQLSDEFSSSDVKFIGINSNPQDSRADVAVYIKEFEIPFPVLMDRDQAALAVFDAKRTPEVLVLDSKGTEIYRGRIDDQYQPGMNRPHPNRQDLRIAIEEYLNGKAISVARTDAVGCLIARRRQANNDSSVTFCKQVHRLLQKHCVECHRPGEIGPFSLLEYDEVVGWADMMLETIDQQRMPPWHANPAHGDFANAREMPQSDREMIRQWVEAGTPFGDASELPTAEAKDATQLSQPLADLEVPMRDKPYEVASEGTIDYQYFVVDPKFKEDRWVRTAEITPSNRSVVHHGIVFIRPPDGVALNGIGWLTAYVPGQVTQIAPSFRARRVPAGSKFVFQMHYTPTGKPELDLSVLRLNFADPSEVTEEHISLISLNQELEIPAGISDVPVTGGSPRLPDDGLLLAMSPHMHLRGKSMRVEARFGQESKVLLDVPRYDFNWQHTYVLREPLPLRSIQELTFAAKFDNSKENPFNPDPTAFVTWGDQTWEEMAIVFYEVAIPIASNKDSLADPKKKPQRQTETIVISNKHREQADTLFRELDGDRDGNIEYEEVDQAVQLRSFRWYDLNGDRTIDRDEAIEALRRMNR